MVKTLLRRRSLVCSGARRESILAVMVCFGFTGGVLEVSPAPHFLEVPSSKLGVRWRG